MTGFMERHPPLAVLSALLIVLALGACGGEDAPPPTATPTTTQIATASPPPAKTPTATAPPETATPVADALVIDIDSETLWGEVYDAFSVGEQACIRDALGAELLESALARPVVNEGESEQWEVDAYACLAPPTARALLLAAELAPVIEEAGTDLSEDQMACVRAATAETDAPAVVAADLPGGDPGPTVALYKAFARCFPDVFVDALIAESGTDPAELGEAERSCLREWVVDIDWLALQAVGEDPEGYGATLYEAFVRCVPEVLVDVLIAEMGTGEAELGEAERSCLLEWVVDIDWLSLEAEEEDPEGYGAALASLVRCVPDAFVASMLADWGVAYGELPGESRACLREWLLALDWAAAAAGDNGDLAEPFDAALVRCTANLPDDHPGELEGATALTVGVAVDGALEVSFDEDAFSFAAEQGKLYAIDVAPGTLSDPWLELLDAGGLILDQNDDAGDSLAPRIVWEAPDSGWYYVKVGGWGTGSYTLTVALSDVPDDHAGAIAGATPVRLGAPVEGAIERPDDTDRFSFEAVVGRLYQVEVTLGTLYDSWVEIQDAEGLPLAWNDDIGPYFGSRIIWEAPASARYYAEVGGWTETGSYTLSVFRNAELEADRDTLLEVRDALRGDAWLNWSTDVPISTWDGVLLDGSPARVAGLFLNDLRLSGTIPPELGALPALGALNLSNNELTGTIPSRLGELGGLFVLILMGNDLSGEIPAALSDLTLLEVLDLGSNRLSGPVPAELGNLAGLRELSLADNQLSGKIPSELGALANLDELWLSDNRLSGDVPHALGDLAGLSALGLGGNPLSGCVPDRLQEQLVLYEFGQLQFCTEAAERQSRAETAPRHAAPPPDSHEGDREVLIALTGAPPARSGRTSLDWSPTGTPPSAR